MVASIAPAPAPLATLPRNFAEYLYADLPISVPATFNEYLAFADTCGYKMEYADGNIVVISSPTDTHELICGNVIWTLKNLFFEESAFRVYGSNLSVLVAPDAHYKPDATVVRDAPEYVSHKIKKRTLKSIVNPCIVVEVLSGGTTAFDHMKKLPDYRACPHMQYILFINQEQPSLTLFSRSDQPKRWWAEDFEGLDTRFDLFGHTITLQQLYHQVIFVGHKTKHPLPQ
jgi:Uma2 family endonuclease